ncbi:uncharacterized protein N7483_004755 [Penicillium malachiteum]|uniref:uncharacterized protein n=1 Tax=Penicillium malachiteum TaxID=1324776 RepID=UPI002548026F|nr:uncharacterized protein N7483_004755 [Penicillium malachiteum]KAJ5730247.1 hypothetical protein N7483_004755 [Penicillium malachiteum]
MANLTEDGEIDPVQEWLVQEQQCGDQYVLHQPRGVSFVDVDVNGYMEANSFQRTFASYIQLIPSYLKTLFGNRGPQQKVRILRDLNGLVRSGEMLLVLGRPGSGCTTFLKTIAGVVNGIEVTEKQNGGIQYEGTPFQEMDKQNWAETIYLAEDDIHLPELSLKETLAFAAEMRPRVQAAELVSRQTASIYGLQQVLDTQVGNDLIRGLSGGEKRRTSIAEAFLSGCPIQCCDNSIRGLDSATALNVVRTLRRVTSTLKLTVLLLYQGRQIYFGSTSNAADYFERLGFVRSDGATTADFLNSLTNPAERLISNGAESTVPRTADEFAQVWQQSPEFLTFKKEMSEYSDMCRKSSTRSSYPTSMMHQINVCITRVIIRSRHNMQGLISAVVGNTILAIILGSLLYNLPEDTGSFESRSILVFYATMMDSCIPAFEVTGLWTQRPRVEKQSRYAFYHPVAEGIASMLTDLPVKALTSLCFKISVYFLANLRRTASAFFTFWLFGLVVMVTMSMIFPISWIHLTYLCTIIGSSINHIFMFIIYAGFVIPPSDQVPWLSWIRYFNPMAYTNESLMINEFRGRRYQCSTFVPSGPTYSDNDLSGKICSAIGSVAGQSWVDGNRYLELKYGYSVDHLWRNLGSLFALMAGFCAVYLLAAEYIQAQRSKGDILLFRRKDVRPPEESVEIDLIQAREKEIKDKDPASVMNSVSAKELSHQSSVFCWSDVGYDIKLENKKEPSPILQGVDGWVTRGPLTALMGSTGAGKTTLLDVLANRKSAGIVHGDVLIDGHLRDGCFQRKTGYVQQADIHLPTGDQKLAYVDTVLQMLEMESYSEAVVGVPGKGLNIEQRKRLTIAVEMAARPELLFLDEPTSGLDSQTAWSICTLLRKLSDNGQPILCTIHQPSAELFQMFDRLLFLQSGCSLYFGDLGNKAATLIEYFCRFGARVPKEGENPAEWLLEVTAASPTEKDWADVWSTSPETENVKRDIAMMGENQSNTVLTDMNDYEYAASQYTQLLLVTRRMFQDYWREPTYLYSKLALCVGSGFFNSISFWMIDHTVQGLTSSLFSCFLLTIIFSTIDQQINPRFIDGREIFEACERQSKTYSWPIFVAANMIIELIWQSLTAIPVFVAWYYPFGFWRNGLNDTFSMKERAILIFLLLSFFLVFTSTLSQAIAASMSDSLTAVNIANLMFTLCLLFCGILVEPDALPRFWIFMYRASPVTYLMGGMIKAALADTALNCVSIDLLHIPLHSGSDSTLSCGSYLNSYVQSMGGRILNPNTTAGMSENCVFCDVTDANTTLKGMSMDVHTRWRDLGIFVVYVVVNVAGIFFFYWISRGRNKSG